MSDLQQYQDKIRHMTNGNGKNNSIGIKSESGKPTKIILGLAGDHVTSIAPVTLHLDADDNIKFVELPNQSRSGSVVVTPTPKLTQALFANAGSEGAMFLTGLSNSIAGTKYTYDHYDPLQAFSKRATTNVTVRLGEAMGSVIDAALKSGGKPIAPFDPLHPRNAKDTGRKTVPSR